MIKGERFTLVADSISMRLDASSVSFNSRGDVNLTGVGDLGLRGNNKHRSRGSVSCSDRLFDRGYDA